MLKAIIMEIKKMKIKDLDTNQLDRAASMLKAIAHPMRIAILSYLEDGKWLTVTEIHNLLNIEQSSTSHHLGILKDKGVLVSQREGKNTFYYLKHESLRNIVDCVSRCSVE
jgi:DNA-binding transcriptional ArsR family regulator